MFNFWNVSNAKCHPEPFVIVDQPNSQCRDKIPDVFELPKLHGLDLFETSVDELQHHLSIGSFDSVAYTEFCLENIRKVSQLTSYKYVRSKTTLSRPTHISNA